MLLIAVWAAWHGTSVARAVDRGQRGQAPGAVRWRAVFSARGLQPAVAALNNALFVSTGEGLLIFDRQTGKKLGQFESGSPDLLSAPVAGKGYAAVADGHFLHAVDAHGRERWRYRFGVPGAASPELTTVPRPLVAKDGTLVVVGLDKEIHAVDADGRGIGRLPIGAFAAGDRAFPLAIASSTLLVSASPPQGGPPALVGLALAGSFGDRRFTVDLGTDVSGLLTNDGLGIVATGYVETSSRWGTTRMVWLDAHGHERDRIERGRHEDLRAVAPNGDLILTSRDPAGVGAGTLEIWTSGQPRASAPLTEPPVAILSDGTTVLSVGCASGRTSVRRFDTRLQPLAHATVDVACPLAATLGVRRGLFLIALIPAASGANQMAELVAVEPE